MRRVDYRVKWSRRRSFGTILAIFGLGIAAVAAVPLYNNLTGAPTSHDTVDSIRAENRPLWDAIAVPPAATPHGPLDEDVSIRKGVTVVLHREFAIGGGFAETAAWYAKRLADLGWRPYDRERWRDFVVYYCKPRWLLTIARRADFATDRRPHHRFNLRLEWARGITESGCPPG